MKRAFRGISQPARNKIQQRAGVTSIWAKLRRRYLPPALRPLYTSRTFQRQAQVWHTICNLASNTKRRFESTKELLRRKTPSAQLYAYHRIACNLPPTHQRPATKAITTAMRKRALPVPKTRRPAILPYLARIPHKQPLHGRSCAIKSPHTANTLYHYIHLPPLSCTHAIPEYRTASTTGDNSTDNGSQSSCPHALASIFTKHTRLTCITATLPSLYPLWSHNTTSFSTPAKALSFPLPNSFAVTFSQQFRGGINSSPPYAHRETHHRHKLHRTADTTSRAAPGQPSQHTCSLQRKTQHPWWHPSQRRPPSQQTHVVLPTPISHRNHQHFP